MSSTMLSDGLVCWTCACLSYKSFDDVTKLRFICLASPRELAPPLIGSCPDLWRYRSHQHASLYLSITAQSSQLHCLHRLLRTCFSQIFSDPVHDPLRICNANLTPRR